MKRIITGEEPDDIDISILTYLAEGFTNEEIGAMIFLSPETVKRRLGLIGEYFGNGQRTAIVATALRRGIIK